MALWTPYADDAALDLSKKCKEERVSPECYPNNIPYHVPSYQNVPYPYLNYPQQYVPAAPPSPPSGGSTCSYMTAPISPRIGMISPPASPTSHHVSQPKRPSYMVDVDSLSDDADFQAFERDALRVMAEKNGGTLLGNNPRMRRAVQTSQAADDSYRKQRQRNNFAAKQSRDRRKLREIHLALKVTYLRNEVAKLKCQLASRSCTRCHQTYPY
ncbi:unnamed protein product [Parnassius apollo]|uniref:(apollo) hypothetical protein n=1 Tax=Parnassius apollo TaxID=110799 RepID=A0A8S3VZ24_PARAO|nr:unnamed protein product [Parnassius apollo]